MQAEHQGRDCCPTSGQADGVRWRQKHEEAEWKGRHEDSSSNTLIQQQLLPFGDFDRVLA